MQFRQFVVFVHREKLFENNSLIYNNSHALNDKVMSQLKNIWRKGMQSIGKRNDTSCVRSVYC